MFQSREEMIIVVLTKLKQVECMAWGRVQDRFYFVLFDQDYFACQYAHQNKLIGQKSMIYKSILTCSYQDPI